jgi:hypothetical protein
MLAAERRAIRYHQALARFLEAHLERPCPDGQHMHVVDGL